MNPKFIALSAEQVEATYTASTKNPAWSLGDVAEVNHHGRRGLFRFSKNVNASALAANTLLKMPVITGNAYQANANVYTAETQALKATLKMDEGNVAAALAANDLAGALAAITLGTGVGQLGLIEGHDAASTSQKVTYQLSRSFLTAPVANDDVQIIPLDFCIYTAAKTDLVTGVCINAPADGAFFWRQVFGPCFVNIRDASAVGASDAVIYCFGPDGTTAGSGLIRNADGEDFDDHPEFVGQVLYKASASADTPALCLVNCTWFTR